MKKKCIFVFSLLLCVTVLAAGCGKKIYGTFAGTSTTDDKVAIAINKDGSISYTEDGKTYAGTWNKLSDSQISANFNGKVDSSCEPLKITVSEDGDMITVESDDEDWKPDHYYRQD